MARPAVDDTGEHALGSRANRKQIATKEALACSRQELKGVRRNGDRKVKERKADGGAIN
jgi:hypothetical protein